MVIARIVDKLPNGKVYVLYRIVIYHLDGYSTNYLLNKIVKYKIWHK